jgi:hypothetical protein
LYLGAPYSAGQIPPATISSNQGPSQVSITSLTIAILATWRLTHFFWGEDGPWDVCVRLRRRAGNGFFGKLLDCFYCLSLWIAAPIAWWAAARGPERILVWLALSGGAILLERLTASTLPARPARWHVDSAIPDAPQTHTTIPHEDHRDVMLRQSTHVDAL